MKNKSKFVCQECGYISITWKGRCPECENYNTFLEEKVLDVKNNDKRSIAGIDSDSQGPVKLNEISPTDYKRMSSGSLEFDRVLGGGFVNKSVILIGGPPGIGKSTIVLQSFNFISKNSIILYVSGEESAEQIKNRAERLRKIYNSDNFIILNETEINSIVNYAVQLKPEYMILDSVQTLYDSNLTSCPGTVSQIKECTYKIVNLSKKLNITSVIIGHVTKSGDFAGPKMLEHMVDTVLYFEGERSNIYRLLRTVKNRFGPTNEIGLFEMTSTGLLEVKDPATYFLAERLPDVSGSTVTATMEGTRPILIEVQALVTDANYSNPRRLANGYNYNRLLMLIAVLEKRAGFNLGFNDIYLNIAGGISVDDAGIDLSTAVSIFSNYKNMPVPADFAFLGELGLAGEVRSVSNIAFRIAELIKFKFNTIIIPFSNNDVIKKLNYSEKINIKPVKKINDVFNLL